MKSRTPYAGFIERAAALHAGEVRYTADVAELRGDFDGQSVTLQIRTQPTLEIIAPCAIPAEVKLAVRRDKHYLFEGQDIEMGLKDFYCPSTRTVSMHRAPTWS